MKANAFIVVLFAVASLAGCLDAEQGAHAGYRWGLGLDLTEPPPPIGALRERPEEIEYWARVAIGSFDNLTAACPDANLPPMMLPSSIGFALYQGVGYCGFDSDAIRKAAEAIRRDDNWSVLEDWRERALAGFAEAQAALSSQAGFPNVTTVEVVAQLMYENLAKQSLLSAVERNYAELDRATDSEKASLILTTYGDVADSSRVIVNVMAHVGNATSCALPGPRLGTSTAAGLHALISSHGGGSTWPPASPEDELSATLVTYLGYTQLAQELDWWPYLVGQSSSLPYYEAYFDHTGDRRLPTHDEARWLWKEYVSRPRSVWTDRLLELYFPTDEMRDVWEREPRFALRVVALEGLAWNFEGVPC